VNDSFGMSGIERVGYLDANVEQIIERQRSGGYAMLQCVAVQKLHGDEMPVLVGVNFVDGADVGMVQGGRSFGFSLKAAECLSIFGYVIGQELEGHKPAEFDILSLVYDTHTAATELFEDAVVRDGAADQRLRIRHVGQS